MQVNSVSFHGRTPKIIFATAKKVKSPQTSSHLCAFTIDPRYKGQITPQKLSQWTDAFRQAEARGDYREILVL